MGEERVTTFSMHAEKNYPVRKIPSVLDVGFDDGLGDEGYLVGLSELLRLTREALPGLVFYNAGVDPHQEVRLAAWRSAMTAFAAGTACVRLQH